MNWVFIGFGDQNWLKNFPGREKWEVARPASGSVVRKIKMKN